MVRDSDGYHCLLIERDAEVKATLMTDDCDDPALAHLKKTVDARAIVKEYFPLATNEEIQDILWSRTSFPDFWNIPEDGWTPLQCLRKQLRGLLG